MRHACLTCNFRDEIRHDREAGRLRIWCIYNNQWHKDNYSCSYWKKYSHNFSKEEKLRMMRYRKNRYKDYLRSVVHFHFNLGAMVIILFLLLIIAILFNRILATLWIK